MTASRILGQIGSQGLKQEITQLRKKNLELQREIAGMKEHMATCTYEKVELRLLDGSEEEWL